MRRIVLRLLLWLVLGVSALNLGATLWLWRHSTSVRLVVERGADEIRAAADREMARAATPERVAARMRVLLAEQPRNWVAIDAVSGVAAERGIALPGDLVATRQAVREADTGLAATAWACGACALDAASCRLSATLVCQAPMVLTPAGDIAGLSTEAWHAARGEPVDRVNLALSVAGLGGMLLAVPSEGSGALLGLGANAARLAHRMGLLTRPMGEMILRAARDGIDWAGVKALPVGRLLTGEADIAALRRLIRPRAFDPVVEVVEDLGRIEAAAGTAAALHLVRYIDDAGEARQLAAASEALGPKVVGRMELMGKSRLLGLTLRLSRAALGAVASLFGLILAAGTMLAHALQQAGLRLLRRRLRLALR